MRLTRFTRGDLAFDVRDEGPAEGTPVVLLHGFPQDATCWDAVAPLLHAQGLRTLAPDQRGYSPGARPGGRAAYRIPELVGDVLGLLDQAGLPSAHLVGHDWGGGVAWATAGAAPERVDSLTVLSTPHPAALTRSLLTSTQALRSWYMAAFQLPLLPERVVLRDLAGTLRRSGLPAPIAERYARRLSEPGAMTAALHWYRAIPLSVRMPVRRISVPTTYVWGERDFALGPRAAESTGDFVRGPYEFRRLPAGHWLPEKRPEEVAAAVVARVTGTGGV